MGSERIEFWQGNEACAFGAFQSGARFFAGYPITPSSEIAEISSRILPPVGGLFLQMEDEISSIAAVMGASLTGAKAFTATSGPGFSLMQENLGMAVYCEVPCVIINMQRQGPSTGLATKPAQGDVMQARWGTHGDHPIIVLSPSSVQECFDLTVLAFNLAERFRIPVILLGDEVVAHMREKVIIPSEIEIVNRTKVGEERKSNPRWGDNSDVPLFSAYGDDDLLRISSSCHEESGYSSGAGHVSQSLNERLQRKISANIEVIARTQLFGDPGAEITLISYGSSVRVAREAAVRACAEGFSVNVLQLKTLWPFPEKSVLAACQQAKAVIVVEMNMGQVVREVERVSWGSCPVYDCLAVRGELFKPGEILSRIHEYGLPSQKGPGA